MKVSCRYLLVFFVFFLVVTFGYVFPQGFREKLQQKIESNSLQFQQSYPPSFKDSNNSKLDRPRLDKAKGESYSYRADTLSVSQEYSDPLSSYAIYKTDYRAELEDNVVTVTGNVIFEVFQTDGWTQIPLVSSQVGLIDAKVNRGTSYIIMRGDKYYLMVDKPGRYTLNIDFLIKAKREREYGPGSFSFDTVPAPISQFEFTIAESDLQVFVEPSIKVEQKQQQDKTVAWAVMPNTSSVSVRWSKALPKDEIVPVKLEPKLYADTATYVSIGEGVMKCETNINYSILQSEVSTFRIYLPNEVNLLNVSGSQLRDWKVSQQKNEQVLDVFLNYGIKGNYPLTLVYERSIGEGSQVTSVAAVKIGGVERENGYIGIAASTNVELKTNKIDRVTVIDIKELPQTIWSRSVNPILLAFKYLGHPFDITIDVTRHQELPVLVAAVDSAEYIALYTEEGKVLTKATYKVRNNVKQFLRLVLPPKATLWSAFVSGKPVKPAIDKEGNVLIPLEKSQLQGEDLRQFPVEIVYLDKFKKMNFFGGSLKMTLPKVDIPLSEVYWSVYFPQGYKYFYADGDVKPVKVYTPNLVKKAISNEIGNIGSQYSSVVTRYQDKPSINKGVLPIKVTVPRQGQLLKFSKLLVTEEEAPWVKLRYTIFVKYLVRTFWIVLILFLAFLLLKKIQRGAKIKTEI